MNQKIFLGANSGAGFVSLYDGFPPEEGVFMHILKGGPGCGKSGFMRSLAEAARERGLDVQEVLCSGDPASLDGVYIPALKAAWVDDTAPHVVEPNSFGADADYENLGRFCRLPLSQKDAEQVRSLNEQIRGCYREAYALLSRAKALHDELEAVYRPYMDFSALTAYTQETIRALF